MSNPTPSLNDTLSIYFLAQGEQRAEDVAARLATFIAGATTTLDIAVYDLRLGAPLQAILADALRARASAGVAIRIVYDDDKPEQPQLTRGQDPAPPGTGDFVQALGYPARRIGGMKLMHHKYLVRDSALPTACIWTGSTNLTDDAWDLEENNILQLATPTLAQAYARDFQELWDTGELGESGADDGTTTTLIYANQPCATRVLFSPGCGQMIDELVAERVRNAQQRIRVCSMLLNSGALIGALRDVLREGRVPVDGIYDQTQMLGVFEQWQEVPHNHWKIGAVQNIIQDARLVGKNSTPYSPTSPHDFMHIKALVVDDLVITGSYNFSHSAELNAENILFLESPAVAAAYSAYVDHLIGKYRVD